MPDEIPPLYGPNPWANPSPTPSSDHEASPRFFWSDLPTDNDQWESTTSMHRRYQPVPGSSPPTPSPPGTPDALECPWYFGVELEMTIRLKYRAVYRDFKDLRGLLSDNFKLENPDVTCQWPILAIILHAVLIQPHRLQKSTGPRDFDGWMLTQDSSLTPDEGYAGVEIVSPVFFSISEARRQLNILWIFLRMYFDVRVSTSCSTHVHISPRGFVAWKKSQLAALAKAVIYFDPVVAAVMPESRRRNHFCLGNIHSEPIKALLFRGVENFGLTPTEDMKQVAPYYGDVFKKIDETLDDKHTLLDSLGLTTPDPLKHFVALMCGQTIKLQSFNFGNLATGGRNLGTVEFRRPPMSTSTEDVLKWASFTLAFVHAAMSPEEQKWTKSARFPTLEELKDFMISRCEASLPVSTVLLESIFSDKPSEPFLELNGPDPITREEKERLVAKYERGSLLATTVIAVQDATSDPGPSA